MSTRSAAIWRSLEKLRASRPLIVGEDPSIYDALMQTVIEEYDPQTPTALFWIKDVVDAEWEVLRLYRLKAGMVNADIPTTFQNEPKKRGCYTEDFVKVRGLLRDTLANKEGAQRALVQHLGEDNLTLEDLAAIAFSKGIRSQADADRMIDAALSRREGAIGRLERLQSTKAAAPPEKQQPWMTDGQGITRLPNQSTGSGTEETDA